VWRIYLGYPGYANTVKIANNVGLKEAEARFVAWRLTGEV
jgi:hypothetical protein